MTRLRYMLAKWRPRRVLRPIDLQIASARRRHKPVAHLIAAKRSLVNDGLRGAS